MPLATMAAIMLAVMLVFGVLDDIIAKLKIRKYYVYYFLICCMALYGFNIRFVPEFLLNSAVLPVLIFCCALADKCGGKGKQSIILLSLLLSVPTGILYYFFLENEVMICLCALAPSIIAMKKNGLTAGIAVSSIVPLVSELIRFGMELAIYDYGFMLFSSSLVDAQLIGILASAVVSEAIELIKRHKALTNIEQ